MSSVGQRVQRRQIRLPNRFTPGEHLGELVQLMREFNEAQSTNNYLVEQLVIARKRNEVLEAHIAELVAYIMEFES